MFLKPTTILFATTMTMVSVSEAARTRWYTTRSCDGGWSLDYQNLGCNVCVDPANDWFAVLADGISSDQRVTSHNQNSCTPASQVGQWYGSLCNIAGNTAIRSFWIACSGQKTMNTNTTFVTLDDNESFKTSGIPIIANIDA